MLDDVGMLEMLDIAISVAFIGLVVWALVVLVKIPAILNRHAAAQAQTNQAIREILIEVRSVTRD